MELQNAQINTAGAYVYFNGCYVFAMGIRPHNGNIPVVRLGGHREGNETGWQCAEREVYEEASLHIKPCTSEITYWADGDCLETKLREFQWQHSREGECDPCLVVAYRREGGTQLSLMYFAETEDLPAPSSEVQGLLLLSREDIHRLCREPLTLGQYLERGCKAILRAEFDMKLVLEPFTQLRLLSRLLKIR